MSLFRRHRWFIAAAGVTLAFAVVSLTARRSEGLTAFADIACFAVMLAAAVVSIVNALSRPHSERSFWLLMTLGFSLWAWNQSSWIYCELVLHQPIPDPYFYDIVLFFHLVPLISAMAWRPDMVKREDTVHLSLLNFFTLLGWWIFLYAFIVFPHQYVVINVPVYDRYYDHLYLLENALLLVVLAFAAFTSIGGWRQLYLHFLAAAATYGVASQFLDRAVSNHTYYSGSAYDIPLIGAIAWMAAAVLSAREWDLKTFEPRLSPRWRKAIPRLAMLAILSLPVIGLWTVLFDRSPARSVIFRAYTVLVAMLVLGAFVFLRQYFQDQVLMRLLQDSRRTYDSENRLQNQLVQKEKLASLGTLVAGAAREIDHPLTSIMSYSERLWAQEGLTPEQNTLLRKIVNQARRTRDLVNDLLSFAQQAPGEKVAVDLGVLLHRASQMLESRYATGKIRIGLVIAPGVPKVHGNANQLFQAFVELVENAVDALEEAGGGALEISAQAQANEVVLQFSDNGTGLREPQRVFDPFYTTKAVGKGTGLGLSAVYGVIQEHSGQITCQNKPEGGALFIVRFPIASQPAPQSAAQVAGAAGN